VTEGEKRVDFDGGKNRGAWSSQTEVEGEAIDPEKMIEGEAPMEVGRGVKMNGSEGGQTGMVPKGGGNPHLDGRLGGIGPEGD